MPTSLQASVASCSSSGIVADSSLSLPINSPPSPLSQPPPASSAQSGALGVQDLEEGSRRCPWVSGLLRGRGHWPLHVLCVHPMSLPQGQLDSPHHPTSSWPVLGRLLEPYLEVQKRNPLLLPQLDRRMQGTSQKKKTPKLKFQNSNLGQRSMRNKDHMQMYLPVFAACCPRWVSSSLHPPNLPCPGGVGRRGRPIKHGISWQKASVGLNLTRDGLYSPEHSATFGGPQFTPHAIEVPVGRPG